MPQTLRVLPNPYCALDADGDPAGAVPRVDLTNTATIERRNRQGRTVKTQVPTLTVLLCAAVAPVPAGKSAKVKYAFESDPATVPDCVEHRGYLRRGEAFAADEATAKLVGIEYVEPDFALELAKERAANEFKAERGVFPHWHESASAGGGV